MTTTAAPAELFPRASEAEAYLVLAEHGLAEFSRRNPGVGTDLIEGWAARKIARWTYPDGYTDVVTFRKYAAAARARIAKEG